MENFKTIEINKAFIIYQVNIRDKYKSHACFINLSTAKKIKNNIEKIYKISGSEIFVTKLIGFLDDDYLHCTNGFRYNIKNIIENEEKFSNNSENIVMEYFEKNNITN